MALSEDLDALCTQQLFRAAESLGFEELDDLDCILSQASETVLSALCTQGPSLSSRTDAHTYPILKPRLQPQLLSSTHQESATGSNRFAVPKTDADVQAVYRPVLFQKIPVSPPVGLLIFGRSGLLTEERYATHLTALHIFCCASQRN